MGSKNYIKKFNKKLEKCKFLRDIIIGKIVLSGFAENFLLRELRTNYLYKIWMS